MVAKSNSSSAVGINIGIDTSNRNKIVEVLEQQLADEHVLYIKLRNFHWNVRGMYFQPLHALFQEHYTLLEEQIDEIAERTRMLGAYASGSMQAFIARSSLSENGHLNGNAEAMLQILLDDQELIIRQLREGVATVEQAGDAGTTDFLTALLEMHEKMAWMLRAHVA
ncbi:MAG: DNA starvation/stationary phase protection protein [Bacteroidota bacterium]